MIWKNVILFVSGIALVICEEELLPGDYPIFHQIPKTEFSCLGKLNWHYYADLETGCQVFHICETQYSKLSFLCPIGSVFNQRHLVCDWWYNVECEASPALYPENNLTEDEPIFFEGSDSSGENADPSRENKTNDNSRNQENRTNKSV